MVSNLGHQRSRTDVADEQEDDDGLLLLQGCFMIRALWGTRRSNMQMPVGAMAETRLVLVVAGGDKLRSTTKRRVLLIFPFIADPSTSYSMYYVISQSIHCCENNLLCRRHSTEYTPYLSSEGANIWQVGRLANLTCIS